MSNAMKISNIDSEKIDEVILFNKEVYPVRKGVEDSINLRFFKNPYQKNGIQDSYIIGSENEIAGQFLLMGTAFEFNSQKFYGIWGMDYIVKEEHRGSMLGSILAKKAIGSGIHFGVNLSEVSLKIHLAFREKIIGEAFKFLKITNLFATPKIFLKKGFHEAKKLSVPNEINGFQLKINPESIDCNWFSDFETLVFSRSKEFIGWKYFSEKDKYYFYQKGNSYFVVRSIFWKGLNCIMLVDCRYDFGNPTIFNEIISTTEKLSKKVGTDAILALSSSENEFDILKKHRFLKPKLGMPIITNFKEEVKKINLNFADSDLEHFYGNNKW